MTYLHTPAEQNFSHDPPRGSVLLLSCMDLRLLDDIVEFMNHDNLTNRYDHVVFAGAALGAMGAPGGEDEDGNPKECAHWHQAFKDHLEEAVKLHHVEDVYILEHRNCGAYHKVFHVCGEFDEDDAAQADEVRCHLRYAEMLEKSIQDWATNHNKPLRTHKFIMDLRGNVAVLCDPGPPNGPGGPPPPPPPRAARSKKTKSKKGKSGKR